MKSKTEHYNRFFKLYYPNFRLAMDLSDPSSLMLSDHQLKQVMHLVHEKIPKFIDDQVILRIALQATYCDTEEDQHIEHQFGSVRIFTVHSQRALLTLELDLSTDSVSLVNSEKRESKMVRKRSLTGQDSIVALVVDDEQTVRMALRRLLNSLNINLEIIEAASGKEAIDIFESHSQIDFIFMDINMQPINGKEATEKIRVSERNKSYKTKIIAVTASDLSRLDALRSDFNDVIKKPFNKKDLAAIFNQPQLKKSALFRTPSIASFYDEIKKIRVKRGQSLSQPLLNSDFQKKNL